MLSPQALRGLMDGKASDLATVRIANFTETQMPRLTAPLHPTLPHWPGDAKAQGEDPDSSSL